MAKNKLKLKMDNSKKNSAICFFTTSENRVRKIFFEVVYCLVSACTITCLTFYEGNEFPLFRPSKIVFIKAQDTDSQWLESRLKCFCSFRNKESFQELRLRFIILYKRSIKRKCGNYEVSCRSFSMLFNVRISRYNLCQKSVFIKRCFMP